MAGRRGVSALDVLDAVYDFEPGLDERAWLGRILEVARGAIDNAGMIAYRYRLRPDAVDLPLILGDAALRELPARGHEALTRAELEPIYAAGSQAWRVSERFGRRLPALRRFGRDLGLHDMFGVLAAFGRSEGVALGFGLSATQARARTDWRRVQRTWLGLAHHLARGAILQRHLAGGAPLFADLDRGPGDSSAPRLAGGAPLFADLERGPGDPTASHLASGASLLTDLERGGGDPTASHLASGAPIVADLERGRGDSPSASLLSDLDHSRGDPTASHLAGDAPLHAELERGRGDPPTASRLDASRRSSEETARVDRWETLLAGRWSIVQTRSAGGRLRLLALENPAAATGLRALTARERQVVVEVARGRSNKAIALDLGVAETSLTRLLAQALRKLGVERREHVPRLAAALQGPASRPASARRAALRR